MTRDELRAQLAFYADLGVTDLYRRAPREPLPITLPEAAAPTAPQPPRGAPHVNAGTVAADATLSKAAPTVLIPLTPTDDTLEKIQLDIGPDCRRCRLCEQRTKIVFGVGSPNARLVFVGEGPGADEDAQGFPFVGRAGQLLTQMIENTAAKEGINIKRSDVYICNVVKCRPPENRTPQPDEMETCGQFLFRQLMTIKPKAICMRPRLDSRQSSTRHERWSHTPARQMAQVARHPVNGDVPPVIPAPPLQPGRQTRILGRPEESSAFRI